MDEATEGDEVERFRLLKASQSRGHRTILDPLRPLIAIKRDEWGTASFVVDERIEANARATRRRPLTATAAEATARERAGRPVSASILCFQHVNAAATQGYSRSNRQPPVFPLAALFSARLPA